MKREMSKKKIVLIVIALLVVGYVAISLIGSIDWIGLDAREKYPNPFLDALGNMCDTSQIVSKAGNWHCDYSKPIKP